MHSFVTTLVGSFLLCCFMLQFMHTTAATGGNQDFDNLLSEDVQKLRAGRGGVVAIMAKRQQEQILHQQKDLYKRQSAPPTATPTPTPTIPATSAPPVSGTPTTTSG